MDVDRRINDSGVAMIIFFDLLGGVARNRDEIIRSLRSGEIGFSERAYKETEENLDKRVENTKARIFEVTLVRLPIILSGDMTITDMGGVRLIGEKDFVFALATGGEIGFGLSADGFGLGAGDRDDKVVMTEVKMREIMLAQGTEDAAESGGEKIEPTSFNGGIFEPHLYFSIPPEAHRLVQRCHRLNWLAQSFPRRFPPHPRSLAPALFLSS